LASLRVQRVLRAPPAAGPIVLAGRHRRPGHHEGTPARRESGSRGPATLPAGRAGPCHAVTPGVAVPLFHRAARRSPDARMPLHARSGSTSVPPFPASADRHFSNAGRASGTIPGHCATAPAGAHMPVASSRIVRHPRAGQRQARRRAASRDADDAHAGPGLRTGPDSCHAADAQRGWPTPRAQLGSAQRAVTRRRPCKPWQVITPEAALMRFRQDGA